MSLPALSVRRPVLTSMATLVVLLLGGVSLFRLKQDLLPNIELPTVTITTEYEGASPEVMERLVTQIVEEIVATVPGVVEMTSESMEGRSQVRVTFGWGIEITTAALDVQSKLQDEINELPEDVVRPRVSKFDVANFPVIILGVSSPLDPVELTEFVENQLRYRFARIPDVAQVDTWGEFAREVRVELNPARLKSLNLPLDTVLNAIRAANVDLPAGKVQQGRHEVTLRAPAEFQDLDQLRATVIAMRNGNPVTLGQVANVRDTYQRRTRIARINGERGLRVAIRKQANANTVDVSRQVLEEVKRINEQFPQVNVQPVVNQGNFIERSIDNVSSSVLYGGALAIFVLMLFLGDVRSTLVVGTAIPISVVGTFALMYFGGLTLNLMTLGGLALGVGMMVDSSIVVLENVFRWQREEGKAPKEAAVRGAQQVASAIVASTITTLVVFLPLTFVRGVSGMLFGELAYVVVFSLVASLAVSLTVVPMLASRWLNAAGTKEGQLAQRSTQLVGRLSEVYRRALGWALAHRAAIIIGSLASFGVSAALVPLLGTEFLPPSDEGEVRVTGIAEVGARLDLVDEQARRIEAIVMPAVPEAVSSVISVGPSRTGGANRAELQLSLTPASQRSRSNADIAQDLRERLAGKVPGMQIQTRAPQGQFLLERVLRTQEGVTVEVRGYDLATLDTLAQQVATAISDVPGITDVDITREAGVPQQEIRINRAKAADLGLSVRDVAKVLETAIAGSQAGEYRVGGNSYRILVQLEDALQRTVDEVLSLTITSASGEPVLLRNVVDARPGFGPAVIQRKDQQRLVSVQANVAGRDLGSVAADVQRALAEVPRPTGYEFTVAGAFEEQQKASSELSLSLLLALLLVYMVLASQYESFRDPLVVMFSVPMAGIGVVLTLLATDTTLNVQSYIGCIMLGGIVVNNAILLVDQTNQLREEGFPIHEALQEAGRRRLRPILMTTVTTILGLVPLALGIGEGADAQAPLARAVIGGLVGSTPITLVLIPVLYSVMHRWRPSAPQQEVPVEAEEPPARAVGS